MARRFNPPPNWPIAPDWTPPPGWEPDPAWPEPPDGWQLWADDGDRFLRGLKRAYLGPSGHSTARKAARGGVLTVLALFLAAGIFGNVGQSSSATAPGAGTATATPGLVTVEDVTGLPVEEADGKLLSAGLTTTVSEVAGLSCSDECVIMSMNPGGGTAVPPKSTVELVKVGKTAYDFYAKHATMPKVTGVTEAQAAGTFRAVSKVVTITYATAKAGQKPGQVVKQSPTADGELQPGQAIKLTVARAKPAPPRKVDPPKNVGKPHAPSKAPTKAPQRPGVTNPVHPGAFCAPEGAMGRTKAGTAMRCSTKAGDSRARWRRA